MSGDPTRLTDGSEAPEELRNLLSAAREDVPSESQLKRVATRLGPLLGGAAIGTAAGAGAASTSGATAGATGGVALGVKVGAALVAAGLVGGSAIWFATRGNAPPPAPVRQPSAPLAAPAPATPPAARQPLLPPAASAATEQPAEPAPQSPKQAQPAEPATAGDSAKKAAPPEASLLQAAQSALKTDPHRALALVEEHRRLYPHGALSQEREVIAIEALTRLGRTSEARKKANDFKQRYPDSAHESKVGATVEGD
jgi:TolA-binding protein